MDIDLITIAAFLVFYVAGIFMMWWLVRDDFFADFKTFYPKTVIVIYMFLVPVWPVSMWFVIAMKATPGSYNE